MDTNDQHQIATEAANQAWNDGLIDQNGKTPLKFIIQAAIEKATEENNLAWGRRIGEKDNEIRALQAELRAAHASERETPEYQEFLSECAKHCRCTMTICESVLAGGICEERIESHDPDTDDNLP